MGWITFQRTDDECVVRRPSRRRTPNAADSDNESVVESDNDSDTISSILTESSDEYEDIVEAASDRKLCCLTTSSRANNKIFLWDTQTGKQMQILPIACPENPKSPRYCEHLSFCWLNSHLLAVLSVDGNIYTYTFVWKENAQR